MPINPVWTHLGQVNCGATKKSFPFLKGTTTAFNEAIQASHVNTRQFMELFEVVGWSEELFSPLLRSYSFFVCQCPRHVRSARVPILHCPISTPINFLYVIVWSLSRSTVCLLPSFRYILRAVLPLFEVTHLALAECLIAQSIMWPQLPKRCLL